MANENLRGPGEKTLTELRQTNAEWRTHHTLELERLRETIYESKKKEVQKRKEEKMDNLEKIQEAKQNKIDGLKTIYLKVKEKEVQIPGHVRKAWDLRLEPVRQNKEKTIKEELERIDLKEYELKKLDKQENHMLEMLGQTEEMESKARGQFNDIRTSPVRDLMEKYKYYLPKHRSPKFNKSFANKFNMKSF